MTAAMAPGFNPKRISERFHTINQEWVISAPAGGTKTITVLSPPLSPTLRHQKRAAVFSISSPWRLFHLSKEA